MRCRKPRIWPGAVVPATRGRHRTWGHVASVSGYPLCLCFAEAPLTQPARGSDVFDADCLVGDAFGVDLNTKLLSSHIEAH